MGLLCFLLQDIELCQGPAQSCVDESTDPVLQVLGGWSLLVCLFIFLGLHIFLVVAWLIGGGVLLWSLRKQKPKKDNTPDQQGNPKKNVDAKKRKMKNKKVPTSKDLKNRVSALINTALSTAMAQLDILEEEMEKKGIK